MDALSNLTIDTVRIEVPSTMRDQKVGIMTLNEARSSIESSLNRILIQKGQNSIQLQDDMRLLGGDIQIDSLDLAVLITEMQEVSRKDPFKAGFRNFRTVGELAGMYAD